MCSASVPDQPSPLEATPSRIIDTACALIADGGVAATSIRSVARSAGVSASLVIHHFGSKAALVDACDARVCEAMDECLSSLYEPNRADEMVGSWMELIATTPYLGYVTQSLRDGGTAGSHLFDRLFEISVDADSAMRADGVTAPTEDPEMRALLMMALDMGMLLMSEQVERTLGASLDSPEIAERWVRGVFEILAGGVLTDEIASNPTDVAPDSTDKEEL